MDGIDQSTIVGSLFEALPDFESNRTYHHIKQRSGDQAKHRRV
jgi:hypothetical protein